MPTENSKIIYLDQKCWINIAKLYYNNKSEIGKNLVKKILEVSETGEAIFPLSMTHLDETTKISNSKRRTQLASLMVKVSKGYSIQPYLEPLIKAEIRNIVLKKYGLKPKNIRNYVLKKGISNLVGAKATLVPKTNKVNSKLSENQVKKILELIESPETIEFALQQKSPKSFGRERLKLVKKLEEIRHELYNNKDNNYRYRLS